MNKKVILSAILGCVGIALLASCQLVTTVVDVSREVKKYPVIVTFEDGSTLTGEAKLPNGATKKVTVTDSLDVKHKIKSEDIASLIAWNENAPDEKHVLFYREKTWRTLEEMGEHLMVLSQSDDYYIAKNGVMTIKGQYINFYGYRPGEEKGTWIGGRGYTKGSARRALLKYLADDPDLCERIENKEIDPLDYETICSEYKPTSNEK